MEFKKDCSHLLCFVVIFLYIYSLGLVSVSVLSSLEHVLVYNYQENRS